MGPNSSAWLWARRIAVSWICGETACGVCPSYPRLTQRASKIHNHRGFNRSMSVPAGSALQEGPARLGSTIRSSPMPRWFAGGRATANRDLRTGEPRRRGQWLLVKPQVVIAPNHSYPRLSFNGLTMLATLAVTRSHLPLGFAMCEEGRRGFGRCRARGIGGGHQRLG